MRAWGLLLERTALPASVAGRADSRHGVWASASAGVRVCVRASARADVASVVGTNSGRDAEWLGHTIERTMPCLQPRVCSFARLVVRG